MAKIKFGNIVADIRGSIGGITYSKNSFGAYAKNKVSPINPQTSGQTNARAFFTSLTKAWQSLTDVQRDGWSNFGTLYGEPDGFGEVRPISGIAAYIRTNLNLLTYSKTRVDNPPANFSVTLVTPPVGEMVTITENVGPGIDTVRVEFTEASLPANHFLVAFLTPEIPQSRKAFDPLLRLIGQSAVAAAQPADISFDPTKYSYSSNHYVGVKVDMINATNGARAVQYHGVRMID